MKVDFENICRAITDDSGELLLRCLRDIYQGEHRLRPNGEDTNSPVMAAKELKLVRQSGDDLRLTDLGFLVANVAKEYCNWIDYGRGMPPPRPSDELIAGHDVLDIGCSFGRWLWAFQRLAHSVVGIEKQQAYVELGRALALREGIDPPPIVCGSAEELDRFVPAASIDLVFSRLVFNHLPVRRTLGLVASRLRRGGRLWLEVERISHPLHELLHGERRLRTRMFALFGMLNTAFSTCTGYQLALPTGGRMADVHRSIFPGVRWWRRELGRAGFGSFQVESRRPMTVAFSARLP